MNLLKMLEKWKIIVIVFLMLSLFYYFTINLETHYENFQSQKEKQFLNDLKIKLSTLLGISLSRIRNLKQIGVPDDTNYKIIFEIIPRNLEESKEPLNSEIQNKLEKMIKDVNFPEITVNQNNIKSFGQISFKKIPIEDNIFQDPDQIKNQNEKQKNLFHDPGINDKIKYLKYLEKGFHQNPFLERSYQFKNQEIYLEPMPTFPTSEPKSEL